MGRKALGKSRINITLPPKIIEWADDVAKAQGMSRSEIIGVALIVYLGEKELLMSHNEQTGKGKK